MLLSEKLAEEGFRPSGFDYLRITLAAGVIFVHSFSLTTGNDEIWDTAIGPFFRMIMPMFFTLSGFLVAGSMERSNTLLKFLGLRLIRIYPALIVEVFLSALILGPLITESSISEYFSDTKFFRYLVNATGHISYELPGVFLNNPKPRIVNGQLWAVPYELLCYITLSLLIALGAKSKTSVLVFGAVFFFPIYIYLMPMIGLGDWKVSEDFRVLGGPVLVESFLLGVIIYKLRDRLPYSTTTSLIFLFASYFFLREIEYGYFIATILLAYSTVCIGLTNICRFSFIKGADYSYGIYLYGYVIQQSLIYFIPGQNWLFNFLGSMILATAIAALSWHWVELPASKLRPYLNAAEQFYLRKRSRDHRAEGAA